jgi:hypothetical protein
MYLTLVNVSQFLRSVVSFCRSVPVLVAGSHRVCFMFIAVLL